MENQVAVCKATDKMKRPQPKDIRTDHWFMGSVFQNSECESILRNIVVMQKKVNPDKWTPFSWEDYKAFCTHDVSDSEKDVLNAFVNGGKPVWNTTAYITKGWLAFDGEKYRFTPYMIEMLYSVWPVTAQTKAQ